MFVNTNKQRNIIRIDSDFARLVDITDAGDLVFELSYNINQSDIIRKNAFKVKITAVARTTQTVNVVHKQLTTLVSNTKVVKNILSFTADTRSSIKNAEGQVASSVISDNTAYVNNELIGPLRSNTPLSNIPGLMKQVISSTSVRTLNSQNVIAPVLQVNPAPIVSLDTDLPSKQVIQKALVANAIDPSALVGMQDNSSLTAKEAINGTYGKVNGSSLTDPKNKSLSTIYRRITLPIKPVDTITTQTLVEDHTVLTLTTALVDQVTAVNTITIPADQAKDNQGNYNQLFINFDVLNACSLSIQAVQQKVDVVEHVQVFYTPRIPPIVRLAVFDTLTNGNIQIKQLDPVAKSARIYRKDFFYATGDTDTYSYVSEYVLDDTMGFVTIPVDVSALHTTIYRVIPVGPHGIVSHEYTNVVIKPKKVPKRITFASVTSQIVDTGINIEIRDVPFDVIALRILRLDATLHETVPAIVGDDTIQVNPQNETATYVVTDTDVKQGHVYEYTCKMIFATGEEIFTGNTIVEYIPFAQNSVSIEIDNLQVSFDISALNVTFDVTSTVTESDVDTIFNLLKQQGTDQFFSSELQNQRNEFQQLIAHQIQRVDLTSGVREDFGIITSGSFSDLGLQSVNSAMPLQAGHRYRYEVSALLRAPESMLQDFVKTSTDPDTNRSFLFSPAKFLHPVALTKGNITTPKTLQANYPKTPMSFGNVGNIKTIEVSFDNDVSAILEASAERFDTQTNLIKWKIKGQPDDFDHFLVIKESLGQRIILGKVNANAKQQTFQYVHALTGADMGALTYVVLPVFNTYAVGTEVQTNEIII